MRCPIWGHVFGSKKSKKSDHQSRFPSKQDFQKSSICSTNPYTFIYTLLSADNRTTRHLLCDLLLKFDDFRTKISGGNPIWGPNFSKFSLPKTCPQHGKWTGEKIFSKKFNIQSPSHDPTISRIDLTPRVNTNRIGEITEALCKYYSDNFHILASDWLLILSSISLFSLVDLKININWKSARICGIVFSRPIRSQMTLSSTNQNGVFDVGMAM